MKKINLAVIFGGKSDEHEVSLSSAQSIIKALDKKKYNVIPIAITKKGNWLLGTKGKKYLELNSQAAGKENALSIEQSQSLVAISESERNLINYAEGESDKKIDLVLPILHGPYGEDGRLQGMLDMLGVAYVFSGVLSHALGMHKLKAKMMAQSAGVPVAPSVAIKKNQKYQLDKIIKQLKLPLVVKPMELGSSVGISISKTKKDLVQDIQKAFEYDHEILLEKYIKGREFTATVIEEQEKPTSLPIIEIIPQISEFYDYKAKYEDGGSKHVCPACLSKSKTKIMQDYAIKVFEVIGCHDLARVDFVSDQKENFYFIDLNTIPGMTKTSLAPEAARASGINFDLFLDKIIENALNRQSSKKVPDIEVLK